MGLQSYIQNLPNQPLAARRRFVVLATSLSFVLLMLLWWGTRSLERRPVPTPPAQPAASPDSAQSPSNALLKPETPIPAPDGARLFEEPTDVNVEELSADLLRALGPP